MDARAVSAHTLGISLSISAATVALLLLRWLDVRRVAALINSWPAVSWTLRDLGQQRGVSVCD